MNNNDKSIFPLGGQQHIMRNAIPSRIGNKEKKTNKLDSKDKYWLQSPEVHQTSVSCLNQVHKLNYRGHGNTHLRISFKKKH